MLAFGFLLIEGGPTASFESCQSFIHWPSAFSQLKLLIIEHFCASSCSLLSLLIVPKVPFSVFSSRIVPCLHLCSAGFLSVSRSGTFLLQGSRSCSTAVGRRRRPYLSAHALCLSDSCSSPFPFLPSFPLRCLFRAPGGASSVQQDGDPPRRRSLASGNPCGGERKWRAAASSDGGRGGGRAVRGGRGGRGGRPGRRAGPQEAALLQGAALHDVRLRGRPEPLHRVRGYPRGPRHRVHHGDDAQGHVHRAAGPRAGRGHRLPHPQGPTQVRQS